VTMRITACRCRAGVESNGFFMVKIFSMARNPGTVVSMVRHSMREGCGLFNRVPIWLSQNMYDMMQCHISSTLYYHRLSYVLKKVLGINDLPPCSMLSYVSLDHYSVHAELAFLNIGIALISSPEMRCLESHLVYLRKTKYETKRFPLFFFFFLQATPGSDTAIHSLQPYAARYIVRVES